jgi:hypothetical protein
MKNKYVKPNQIGAKEGPKSKGKSSGKRASKANRQQVD